MPFLATFIGLLSGDLTRAAEPVVLSPLVWSVVAPPVIPVRGSDARLHLAYELLLTNVTDTAVRIESVEVVDPLEHRVIDSVNRVEAIGGEEVAAKVRQFSRKGALEGSLPVSTEILRT